MKNKAPTRRELELMAQAAMWPIWTTVEENELTPAQADKLLYAMARVCTQTARKRIEDRRNPPSPTPK